MHNGEGIMWPKPDTNGDHKGETVKLSRDAPQQNGDDDKLLEFVRSGKGASDGEKDSGEWMRRAIYQVRLQGGPPGL